MIENVIDHWKLVWFDVIFFLARWIDWESTISWMKLANDNFRRTIRTNCSSMFNKLTNDELFLLMMNVNRTRSIDEEELKRILTLFSAAAADWNKIRCIFLCYFVLFCSNNNRGNNQSIEFNRIAKMMAYFSSFSLIHSIDFQSVM